MEVAPGEIAQQLLAVRERVSLKQTKGADGHRKGDARVTLDNLVLLNRVSDHCVSAEQIDRVIEEICFAHPSRIFVLDYIANDEASSSNSAELKDLVARVGSRCMQAANGERVCSEEVYLKVPASGVAVVPNLITSLLVPDVQSTLVLMSDPLSFSERPKYYEFSDSLAAISDLVIYDSSLFKVFDRSYDRVAELRDLDPAPGFSERRIRDLNWGRIERWKALIAESFEAELIERSASSIREIRCETECNRFGSFSAESLLLLGWCLAKLGLHCETTDKGAEGVQLSLLEQNENQLRFRLQSEAPSKLKFLQDNSLEITLVRAGQSGNRCAANCTSRLSFLMNNSAGDFELTLKRDTNRSLCELSTNMSAESSGENTSCDLNLRTAPFRTPELSELLSARAADQRRDPFQAQGEVNARCIAGLAPQTARRPQA